ncbi:MAG: hypothetical protein Q9211_006837 [Gyalolechia sp. 1 TL-2023]
MDRQTRPTSNIPPRLSRLPVRSSTTIVQRPEQSAPQRPIVKAPAHNEINISRSRPRGGFPRANGLPEGFPTANGLPASPRNGFVKPPPNPASVRNKVTASKVASVEEDCKEGTEPAGEQRARKEPTRINARKPRPSLSDRAAETLSQIPPSPSPRRRQSGFFPTDSPAIRPPSSFGRSRPVTSTGFYPPLPTSRPVSPTKRPQMTRPSPMDAASPSKLAFGAGTAGRARQRPPTFGEPSPFRNARSTARDPKAINDTVKSLMSTDTKDEAPNVKGSRLTGPAPSTTSPKASLKSSAALRETIANAKAARRAAPKYEADEVIKPVPRSFAGSGVGDEDDGHVNVLRKRINSARNDGKLNISGMGLKKFPDEVLKMYDPDAMIDGAPWYECVGMTRLDVSNNEMDDLDWDRRNQGVEDGENGENQRHRSMFSGLQSLHLQNNRLHRLPSTLGHLEDLTVLNLSRNRLNQSMSDLIHVVSNIRSLRELLLAENGLSGPWPPLAQCSNLEILDLHDNALTSLPEGLSNCMMLRRLDISSNMISQLPCLHLPNLAMLNVSMNQINIDDLTANLTAPTLSELDISACRIDGLPALRARYASLISLTAYDNRISMIDVESVRGLEVLDLRRNDIRNLPPELSLLGLKKMLVAGNPMRAPRREILEGTTERLMEWLRGRLPAASVLDDETF